MSVEIGEERKAEGTAAVLASNEEWKADADAALRLFLELAPPEFGTHDFRNWCQGNGTLGEPSHPNAFWNSAAKRRMIFSTGKYVKSPNERSNASIVLLWTAKNPSI